MSKMKRIVILVTLLCMVASSAIASKRAITFVSLSSDIDTKEAGPLWNDMVTSDVNLKLASIGYKSVSANKCWQDFMEKHKVTDESLEAEWMKYLKERSDIAVNIYVDRYAVNKDKTVDCRVSLMVVPVDAPDKVLVHTKVGKEKVKGMSRMDLLKKLIAEEIHSKISVLQ